MGFAYVACTLGVVTLCSAAAAQSGALLEADLGPEFAAAAVSGGQGVQPTSRACGGVTRSGIFAHPTGQPCVLTYQLDMPLAKLGERIIFHAYCGIADGFDWNDREHPANGVKFILRVNGKPVGEITVAASEWRALCADLTPGGKLRLELVTDAIGGNSNYDWAVWGEPAVYRLLPQPSPGRAEDPGVFLIKGPAPAEDTPAARWARLGETDEWLRVVRDPALLGQAYRPTGERFGFQAQLLPLGLSFSLGLPEAGRELEVRCRVRNASLGPWRRENAGRPNLSVEPPLRVVGEARMDGDIPPGAEGTIAWPVAADGPGQVEVSAEVEGRRVQALLDVIPPLRALPPGPPERPRVAEVNGVVVLENRSTRLALTPADGRIVGAVMLAWVDGAWHRAGTIAPLAEVWLDGSEGIRRQRVRPDKVRPTTSARRATVELEDQAAGVRLRLSLEQSGPIQVSAELTARDGDLPVRAFYAPVILAGDAAFGERKTYGLFPGLEFLEDREESSSTIDCAPPINDRRVPDPHKITIPLMAISGGRALVGLIWDPVQQWDEVHRFPAAKFASPNFIDDQANHLMALFIPGGAELVKENADMATQAYVLPRGKSLRLTSHIICRAGEHALDALDDYFAIRGIPDPEPWPRDYEAEKALCRHGFLHTVYDPTNCGFRHCIGWASGPAPGYLALLWRDMAEAKDPLVRGELRERIQSCAEAWAKQNPGVLASGAQCHIMHWEFPFYYGYLPEALGAMEAEAKAAISSQGPDGTWRFHPADEKKAKLGPDGANYLGTSARQAWVILRWARISGDRQAAQAGFKALAAMRLHRVPRGAQGWECPVHEPDILAAAWAIRACVEGYRVSGSREHLDQAVYWAKSGLPFVYLWQDPDKPGMRYAAIPVLGTTFFTHSWFGVPVQWCGLVYARGLQELSPYDTSLPWAKVAEGITVSAMHQQFDEGDRKGCYPDGWYGRFTLRQPPFINPEDILVNLFGLTDRPVEIFTDCRSGLGLTVSSGAKVTIQEAEPDEIAVTLNYFLSLPSYTVIFGCPPPARVSAPNREVAQSADLEAVQEGYRYDVEQRRLYLKVKHEQPVERVLIRCR